MIENLNKEFRRVKGRDLLPNPRNWRTHPQTQADAMRGVLSEVGYAGTLLAYETPEGLRLIDGHLRAEIMPDQEIDVAILNVDDAKADKLLATHDPLAAMAEADEVALAELLKQVNTGDEALQQMLSQLAEDEGIIPPDFEPASLEDQGRLDQKKPVTCPECGHEFSPAS